MRVAQSHNNANHILPALVEDAVDRMRLARLPIAQNQFALPRPTGTSASMTFSPVCNGTTTGWRSMIACRTLDRHTQVRIHRSFPVDGCPTDRLPDPVDRPPPQRHDSSLRSASSPACNLVVAEQNDAISVSSTLKAMPSRPPGTSPIPRTNVR